jgi:1-aminocyclopropane-1-carboxylate deaminase/D-cysteine desulfhydrase-like pyridoxal-dependent ACC family enzyme
VNKILFDTAKISIDTVANDCLTRKRVSLSVLRLDKIHPVVSGNKLFKLHYFLQDAITSPQPGLLTFGGAYSNHLVATAFASKTAGIKCIGLVRGEKPAVLSPTLQACKQYGMQLHFLSRGEYSKKDESNFMDRLPDEWKKYVLVPEGGYHPKGAAGAALITQLIAEDTTHICTALGTATTIAGLIAGAKKHLQIIGIPVLKGMTDINKRMEYLTGKPNTATLLNEYHFGGYAKKNKCLLQFMNSFYDENKIPTDFVYTAKMMFGVMDSIENNFFPEGSKIVCLHTGGLQGNASLPAGSLIF